MHSMHVHVQWDGCRVRVHDFGAPLLLLRQVVKAIESVGDAEGKPSQQVVIADCGEL